MRQSATSRALREEGTDMDKRQLIERPFYFVVGVL
jgi:hypothetical protein